MEITELMLEEKKQEYENLQKDYEQVHFQEQLYRVAIALAKHTVSVVNIQEHSLEKVFYEKDWLGGTAKMLDVPESIIATGTVHKDSIATYRRMFDDIYAGKPSETYEVRVQDQQGVWSWLNISYKTIFDKENRRARAVCYSENITQKRESENIFQQLLKIVHQKSDYFYQVNLTKDMVNQISEGEVYRTGAINGMSYSELNEIALESVVPEHRKLIEEKYDRISLLQQFYDGNRDIVAQYEYIWPGSTEPVWLESHMYLMMNTDGDICGVLSARNIEEEKASEDEMGKRAKYDQLCPVLKRDIFMKEMEEKMAQRQDMSLFMMDVDRFKQVNDQYGHTFGDQVLVRVAETINSNFRKSDLVARYGGDEFCVALSGKFNSAVLESSAKLLLERVRHLEFENGFCATISIGIAPWNQVDDMETLFSKADQALYRSKKQRDTFTLL